MQCPGHRRSMLLWFARNEHREQRSNDRRQPDGQGASMIDREPLKRAQKAWRKRQNEAGDGFAGRFRPVRALGGPSKACPMRRMDAWSASGSRQTANPSSNWLSALSGVGRSRSERWCHQVAHSPSRTNSPRATFPLRVLCGNLPGMHVVTPLPKPGPFVCGPGEAKAWRS